MLKAPRHDPCDPASSREGRQDDYRQWLHGYGPRMSIVRIGVVALVAAAAVLGFKKVKQSRSSESLAPMSGADQDEAMNEPSWPVGAR